ncbi:hypothetical protein ECDEC3B_1945 [Escherichia coli DEC3B]|nr:hypothetical protein ECDEC3B_1945 [Escherichia coli DEC3B]
MSNSSDSDQTVQAVRLQKTVPTSKNPVNSIRLNFAVKP